MATMAEMMDLNINELVQNEDRFLSKEQSMELVSLFLLDWGLADMIDNFKKEEIQLTDLHRLQELDIYTLSQGVSVHKRLIIRDKIEEHKKSISESNLPLSMALSKVNAVKEEIIDLSEDISHPSSSKEHVEPEAAPKQAILNPFPTPRLLKLPIETTPPDTQLSASNVNLNFDLKEVLARTVRGKAILSHYNSQNVIEKKMRSKISEIIINEVGCETVKYSPSLYQKLTDKITQCFPTEYKFRHEYYSPSIKNAEGRYTPQGGYLISRRTRMNRLVKSTNRTSDGESSSTTDSNEKYTLCNTNIVEYPEESQAASKTWLQTGTEPPKQVEYNLEISYQLRRSDYNENGITLPEICNRWPFLKTNQAKKMIDFDFEKMFPNKGDELLRNWKNVHQTIVPLLDTNLKDGNLKELLSIYHDDSRVSDKDCLLALMLAGVIQTNYRVTTIWKPSIMEMVNGFILHIENSDEIDDALAKRRVFLQEHSTKEKNLQYQPQTVIVGDRSCPHTIFTYYDGTKFYSDTILEGIDCTFKMIFLLNKEYSDECVPLWTFIQRYCYKMILPTDNVCRSLRTALVFAQESQIK